MKPIESMGTKRRIILVRWALSQATASPGAVDVATRYVSVLNAMRSASFQKSTAKQ